MKGIVIGLLFAAAMTTLVCGAIYEFKRKTPRRPPRKPHPLSPERQAEIDARRKTIKVVP